VARGGGGKWEQAGGKLAPLYFPEGVLKK